MHTMAYHSVNLKKGKIWMKLESIMSNETSETDYDFNYIRFIDALSSQQFTYGAQHLGSSL